MTFFSQVNKKLESPMNREVHVRFCGKAGVKFPCLTRLAVSIKRPCTKIKKLNDTDIMKARLITLVFVLLATTTFAQTTTSETPIQNVSPDSAVVYRLFATKNRYTFIKLNTRNGQMSHVQWGTGTNDSFEYPLSDISRVSKEDEKNGRFFLYPTTNIYNFILLDQIDGRAWQVQWNTEEKSRLIFRIN